MKLKILAAVLTAAALPVLAQTTTAPVEARQARLEVADPGSTAAPKKASPSKSKSTKTAKKSSKKKSKPKTQAAG